MHSPEHPQAGSPRLFITMLALTVLNAVALVPIALASLMSPMMFDAPGSEKRVDVWLLFLGILSVPIVTFLLVVISWVGYGTRRRRLALGAMVLASLILLSVYAVYAGLSLSTE